MRMDENDSFFKLKEQLEDAQKLMGRMEQYIVEARGVLQSCIRRQSEFQYAYLGDMIQETAKKARNIRAVLLTALYNSVNTINSYYGNRYHFHLAEETRREMEETD